MGATGRSDFVTALRLVAPGGAIRAFELVGDQDWFDWIRDGIKQPSRFVVLGFFHIDGTDHLLFPALFCDSFRRRPLIVIAPPLRRAFNHALLASACDLAPGALWFPPLIETLIAIVDRLHGALENIVMWSPTALTRRPRVSSSRAEGLALRPL